MNKSDLKKIIKEEIRKIVNETNYGVPLKTSKKLQSDLDVFKMAEPIYLAGLKAGKLKPTAEAFFKLVQDIVIANGVYLHDEWKKTARDYYMQTVRTAYMRKKSA
jgi:hypothetical protein